MDEQIRKRRRWVRLYEEVGNAGIVCRRCGISRPTLRKWLRRYASHKEEGLREQSRRPKRSPARKANEQLKGQILELRKRQLGARRIQNELQRLFAQSLSLATIHKVLVTAGVKPLAGIRRRTGYKIYSRPVPGDRVQMDTCKIGPGLYQYTAVDDCTRYRVLALYSRRSGANTLLFLDKCVEEFPFPIQRVQTDRGREFFDSRVQARLKEFCIKFRPTKPRSPHLNGKVERSQKTDLQEFYTTVDLRDPQLNDRLQEWQHHYNWERGHGSLHGCTPMERYFLLSEKTPFSDEVEASYEPEKERVQDPNYRVDLKLRKLKGCL